MADLLIQGMRMPHLCIDCRLNYGEKRPEHGLTIFCKYSNGVVLPKAIGLVGRLPTCGLLELPEHGDLIEKQTALAALYSDYAYAAMDIIEKEVPVIIPSNREDAE